MKKNLLIAPRALGLALSLAACSQAAGQTSDDELTGPRRMTSLEVGTEGDLQAIGKRERRYPPDGCLLLGIAAR